ncbi:MAG: serine hydrolase [Clostridium sp.]
MKCGTPVEEDGIFYEENFYLPKSVIRKNRRQAMKAKGLVMGSKPVRQKLKIATVIGIIVLFVGISFGILNKAGLFAVSNEKTQQQEELYEKVVEVEENKAVINIDNEESEIAFTSEGDKTDIDKEIAIDESNQEEIYDKLIRSIEEQGKIAFNNWDGTYAFAFKDLESSKGISIGSEKAEAASSIKLFIMIEAYNEIAKGLIKADEVIVLKDSMKADGSGILTGYPSGEAFTYEELIDFMMIKSDNTAANILIEKFGFNAINNKIKTLGCKDSELNRKMMDSPSINSGLKNYVSVDDLALVLEKLYRGEAVSSDYDKKMLDIMKANEQKNKIAGKLPQQVIVANKSGDYYEVTNDAGIIYTEEGSYIFCVTAKGNNIEIQNQVIADLSKSIYDLYIEYRLSLK